MNEAFAQFVGIKGAPTSAAPDDPETGDPIQNLLNDLQGLPGFG